ncbi:pyroglutamyl-peptidase I [Brachybacterium sp. p3-SID1565]|uniref:pyroglutamyl-peptidase I n=1 Tax=Brachybacterium sp. p3-SID1565 TaxID=2916046 RepID=UPI0021A8C5E2|nr:pyroglutamyl-peptidase I [Brachybacterium sp. p3-SID1565]MCT1385370.1 pyroglutamyl-peptidase I [Brachybacterium sp. p3-SID1565]
MTVDVLLTGFAPFDGADINESWQAVQAAAAQLRAEGVEVAQLELPVEFDAAGDLLEAAVREHRCGLVVATGLAAGRRAVTPERVAINVRDARIPDNSGDRPVDEPVVPGGPVGHFSTLPIKAIVAALAEEPAIPAAVSQTAGTYVCNDVFYRLLHLLATDPGLAGMRGGFVHLPAAADLPVEDSARALVRAVRTCLATPEDVVLTGGAEH